MNPVEGVLPVIHTPWNADGSVDADSLRREVDWVFDTGADGCAIALASDILRMTPAERVALIRTVAGLAGNRGPLIASVGAEETEQAVAFAKAALDAGATALMAIPPREQPLDEAGLTRYFGAIVEATPLPLIVQDASSYVGSPMTPEFQAGLLDRWGPDRVWFKPEANPAGPLITRLGQLTKHRARIFEGSGAST
jgi:4-hydroxy-tetrahydrodipicolinate synthase